MPQKQTRESIEAELNASESERVIQQLREVIEDCDEVEKELRRLEDALGLSKFYQSKPLPERMRAVGMSQAAIDRVNTAFDAIDMMRSGRSDELPDQVKNDLAAQADAELSAAEQLAAIVARTKEV
jgi:hypothetical protein